MQPSIFFSFSLPVFLKPRKAQKNNPKFLFVRSASMASTSKSAILGGTTTLVEYVVVDVAHKGESVVEAFNEAKAGLEAH